MTVLYWDEDGPHRLEDMGLQRLRQCIQEMAEELARLRMRDSKVIVDIFSAVTERQRKEFLH